MNRFNSRTALLISATLHAMALTSLAGGSGVSLLIAGVTRTNGQLRLSWTGGRPNYQLQRQTELGGSWVNVGPPTNVTTAVVPLNGSAAFYRVANDYTARYQVVFNATWSASSHPTNYPSGSAHWSGLVGGTHSDRAHFFREGETATESIRNMAELGSQSGLLSEVNAAISAGNAHFPLAGGGLGSGIGSRTLAFPQPMRRDFPLVTLCSMIAPSPDWFVGAESVSLIENGEWAVSKVVTLYGNDAGTDSGASYASADQVTTPRGVVRRFTGFPAIQSAVIVPFGTFTFTRLD